MSAQRNMYVNVQRIEYKAYKFVEKCRYKLTGRGPIDQLSMAGEAFNPLLNSIIIGLN